MNIGRQNQIDEGRAAILLGIPSAKIRRISRLSGLGHVEKNNRNETLYFTYEELRKLCLLSIPATE